MSVFITQANARKIEGGVDREKLKKLYLEDLYHMSLWMLSKKEQQWLASLKMLYQNSEFFIQEFYCSVQAEKRRDSDWVYVSDAGPAYHISRDCEKLNSTYINYQIPPEICHRGNPEKEKFRVWFKENKSLLEHDPNLFSKRLEATFALRNPPHIEEFKAANSGVEIFENVDLENFDKTIQEQIENMKNFYDKNKSVLSEYGIRSYSVLKEHEKQNNSEIKSSLKDEEINILRRWQDQKEQLKSNFRLYLKLRFNPDLSFSRGLLDQLGFHCCKECGSDATQGALS